MARGGREAPPSKIMSKDYVEDCDRLFLATHDRTSEGHTANVYGFLQVCFLAGLSCAMDPGGKGRTGGATKQCYVTISCEENHLVNT